MRKLQYTLVFAIVLLFESTTSEARVTRYLTGNPADVQPVLQGAAHDFGGGGTDVDPAIQWMINEARGCTDCDVKVDVVVLRATGSNGYNAPIAAMNGVDSVETLVITDRKDALKSTVLAVINLAEVIFFAGGDQCDYVRLFKGTGIERAVKNVYRRGGAVGGTSAGLAIQSEFVYDACSGSVSSADALHNPYDSSVTFTENFFNWNNLQDTLTDTHFQQRDRMGRLMAFLARQIRDGRTSNVLGIAVNEATSVVVDRNGLARVMGSGAAYFVLADHQPEICEPNMPLTYSNYKIWKVSPGETFDLQTRPTSGYYQISVNAEQLSANPY
ncbi:MAG: Type 1 glutamine amidotransferase-like domain-containing protein [Pyrinomonadaceae bacterium]